MVPAFMFGHPENVDWIIQVSLLLLVKRITYGPIIARRKYKTDSTLEE